MDFSQRSNWTNGRETVRIQVDERIVRREGVLPDARKGRQLFRPEVIFVVVSIGQHRKPHHKSFPLVNNNIKL